MNMALSEEAVQLISSTERRVKVSRKIRTGLIGVAALAGILSGAQETAIGDPFEKGSIAANLENYSKLGAPIAIGAVAASVATKGVFRKKQKRAFEDYISNNGVDSGSSGFSTIKLTIDSETSQFEEVREVDEKTLVDVMSNFRIADLIDYAVPHAAISAAWMSPMVGSRALIFDKIAEEATVPTAIIAAGAGLIAGGFTYRADRQDVAQIVAAEQFVDNCENGLSIE